MVYSRLRLRRAALRMVARGWPVAPGAPLRGGRFDCGRSGCHTRTCHPALPDWRPDACREPTAVARWWCHAPYALLLPTGVAFDAIEVPAPLGAAALARPRWREAGPVLATPDGRWTFLVHPGQALRPQLAQRLDLVRHCHGSWVPAPPTRLAEGRVRWVISPGEVDWRLPAADQLQQRLLRALPSGSPATRPALSTLPRVA